MHCTYVLRNKKSQYYIGSTSDLRRRVTEHKKLRPDYKLIYYEAYPSSALARRRETKLKQYGSAWRSLKTRLQEA